MVKFKITDAAYKNYTSQNTDKFNYSLNYMPRL